MDKQFLLIQALIDGKNQDYDEKMKKYESDLDNIKKLLKQVLIQNQNSSPDKMDSPKAQDPTTLVLDNNKASPLEGVHSTKVVGMWTLKNDINSPKFYELLIKTELKGNIAIDIKNSYNHIKMSLNVVTRLQQDRLPTYYSIKRHSEFKEYFVTDCSHPFYPWNAYTYNSLGHSLLVALQSYPCVKYSMAPQTYKAVTTHAHEIPLRTILLRLL